MRKKKMRYLFLLVCIAFVMIPYSVNAAPDIGSTINLVSDGDTSIISGRPWGSVIFGSYKQSRKNDGGYNVEPIKWQVLQGKNKRVFLLSDRNLDVMKFNESSSSTSSTWKDCSLRAWLNGYDGYTEDSFIGDAFSSREQLAIGKTEVVDEANPEYGGGGDNTEDKIFLLSYGEIINPDLGFSDNDNDSARIAKNTAYVADGGRINSEKMKGENESDSWWLRTQGYRPWWASSANANYKGNIDLTGHEADFDGKAVRPALNMDFNSVLFMSGSFNGKKSGSVGADALISTDGFVEDEWKLTLKDYGDSGLHKNFSIDSVSTCDGKILDIKYSGATTGDNEYISAAIKDKYNHIIYYGNLKSIANSDDASGNVQVKIENKLNSTDTLYLFNEQANGVGKTDYASEIKTINIPTKLHDLVKTEAKEATCTEAGNSEYWSCEKCGKYFGDESGNTEIEENSWVISKKGHNYGSWTKLNDEEHQRVCANDETHVEKAKHTWNEGVVTKEPTCTQKGEKTFTCTVCNGTKKEDVNALGHNMTRHEAVEENCTEDGNSEYWSCEKCGKYFGDESGNTEIEENSWVISKKGHKYGSWTKLNDEEHQRVCANDETHVEKAKHTWNEGVVTKEPTCTQKGEKTFTCTVCNGTKKEDVNALGHNMTRHEAVEENCTEDGNSEYWSCGRCQKYFSDKDGNSEIQKDSWIISKKGHKYGSWTKLNDEEHQRVCANDETHVEKAKHTWNEGVVTKEPTCTQKGEKTFTCTVCNGTKKEDVNALGHNMTRHEAVEENCTEDGNSEYWSCGRCQKYFSDKDGNSEIQKDSWIISKKGHKYGSWTKLNDEEHQRICENDETHVEKAKHTWNEGEVTEEPTTTETGMMIYTCTACKATKLEIIPVVMEPEEKPETIPENDKAKTTQNGSGTKPNQSQPHNSVPSTVSEQTIQFGTDGTPLGEGASVEAANKAITSMKRDIDPKGSVFRILQLKSTKQTKKSVKVQWKKIVRATTYIVYGNTCGNNNRMTKLASTRSSFVNFKKIAGKKVKKGKSYKFLVIAIDKNNKVVSASKLIHVVAKGGKTDNPKRIIVKAKVGKKTKVVSKVKIKKGKSLKLKTTINAARKKLKIKTHVSPRFESSNIGVVTVNKKGVINAKGKGSCKVYVYAQNGICKTEIVKVN